MKKVIFKALSLMLLFVACGSLSSCDTVKNIASSVGNSDITKQVLNTVLSNYVTGTGTTYNYTGTLSSVLMKKNSDGDYAFVNGKGTTTSSTGTCPLIVGTTGNITLPTSITVDGATMSNVALGALTIGGTDASHTLTVSDSTTGQGTLTVSGTSYSLSSVYVESTYTTSTLKYEMSIYFGTNLEYAVNVSFNGTVK